MGNRQTLEDEVFNLKFASKTLKRQSTKCQKSEKVEKGKVKKAMQQGNHDIARIHAENAIRHRSQYLNFLRLASRMEAIAQRMQSAVAMKNLNKSMVGVTKVIGKAVEQMDIETITKTMDKFEKNFEDLDIQSSVMQEAIQSTNATLTPEEQVSSLMRQVADEHGLEVEANMDDVLVPSNKVPVNQEEADLEARFNQLKSSQ